MEFSEVLIKEHAAIRRAIYVLEEMMQDEAQGIAIDVHDVNALLIFPELC